MGNTFKESYAPSTESIDKLTHTIATRIGAYDKSTGALISRLLTKNCPNELSKANKANPLALQKVFEFVGQVAMQELMTNDDVTKAISGYANYIDQEKIGELLNSN